MYLVYVGCGFFWCFIFMFLFIFLSFLFLVLGILKNMKKNDRSVKKVQNLYVKVSLILVNVGNVVEMKKFVIYCVVVVIVRVLVWIEFGKILFSRIQISGFQFVLKNIMNLLVQIRVIVVQGLGSVVVFCVLSVLNENVMVMRFRVMVIFIEFISSMMCWLILLMSRIVMIVMMMFVIDVIMEVRRVLDLLKFMDCYRVVEQQKIMLMFMNCWNIDSRMLIYMIGFRFRWLLCRLCSDFECFVLIVFVIFLILVLMLIVFVIVLRMFVVCFIFFLWMRQCGDFGSWSDIRLQMRVGIVVIMNIYCYVVRFYRG